MDSNHTQSTAYVVGEIAAEKLMRDYNLQGSAHREGGRKSLKYRDDGVVSNKEDK